MKPVKSAYIIIALCLCAFICTSVFAQSSQWEIMIQPEIKIFRSVWGTSKSDVFAVGDRGLIMHFNGIEWKQMDSNTEKNLQGIWGSTGIDVFAAGDEGIVLHYNGTAWNQMDCPTKENLTDIWGSSGADVFISGFAGTLLHYDGKGWQSMSTNSNKNLYGLWGTSGADVFAAGGNGTILHYNGAKWVPMNSGTDLNLLTVKGTSGSDIIAAGPNIILYYDGRNWVKKNEESFHFRCIWGNSPSDNYIGGNNQDNLDTGFVFHYNGSKLEKTDIDPDIPVYGLWGSSDSDIFAAGGNQDAGGVILYFDGINWTRVWQQSDKGSVKKFSSLWGSSGNNVFAAGEQGIVAHYDGKNWSFINSGTKEDLKGIWGYSENNLFVVGDQGTVIRFDNEKWINMSSNTDKDLNRIWGYIKKSESEPELFAAGEKGTILSYDKSKWIVMDSGTNNDLKNIWGNSDSDIYAAGDHGTILHYDGKKWSSFSNVTDKDLKGIWGSAENNIYAAGDSNIGTNSTSVFRYNGLNWRSLSINEIFLTTNEYFTSIWGRSQDNIFLAGSKIINAAENKPVIWHYNGKIWSPMSITAGTKINDIWGVSSNISPVTQVFAVSADGAIVHYWEITLSLPERVDEADGLIAGAGKVSIKDILGKDLTISLISDDTSEIILPETLVIPAGQTSNTFDIIVKDDNFPDGTRDVLITAWASGYNSGTSLIRVDDNESLELKINIPLKVNEADGLIKGTGKVSIPGPLEDDIYVSLTSDNSRAVKVPPGITIPAGMSEAVFDMMAVDDTDIDGIETALVTAFVKGWIPASAKIEVSDDDKYGLSLELPETAEESDEILKNAGVVSIPVEFYSDIFINLSSDDTTEINVPDTVIIPAGSKSASFDLFPLKDFLSDDVQSVNISASSPEFISADAVIDIGDSDFQWTVMEKGTSNLRSLWGSSKDDIFSAGWYGVIMHYDGITWQHMETNTQAHLRGIWGSSRDNVFAVGNDGTILHYNGKEWSVMDSGTDMTLYDLWGSSGTDVFAVGGSSITGGIILHYDGKKWHTEKKDLNEYMMSIWGVSANNITAVGEKGAIIQYNGKNWAFMENSDNTSLKGIWGSARDDYFAVGSGVILHYNGIEWNIMETGQNKNLIEIWGLSKDDIYAIGYSGIILHYDGFSWNEMESGTQSSLWGVWGTSDAEMFISGVDGLILKNNGALWETSKETDTYLKGIWCAPQKNNNTAAAYAVGDNGTIVFYDGIAWNKIESDFYPNLNSIWGTSDSEIFAVGDEGIILRFDGFRWRKTDSGVYENLNDVSGLSFEYDRDVFAVGENGTILHFDGSLWHRMESPTDKNLRGVWAFSDESIPDDFGQYNIIAAGDDGLILYYNGNTWQQMETGISKDIYDVWGTSLSDIYAVGPGGTILHYDGNHWQNIDMVNNTLTGVWGRSSSDVYIAGYSGTILHYDGFKWIHLDTVDRSLTGICGNAGLEIFAVGRDNTIVHYQAIGIKIPESAQEGDNTLAGQGHIFIGTAQDRDIIVRLTSHDTSEISLPDFITIPAGQTSVSFDLTIAEDDIYDGLQRVPVTTSAQGFSLGTGFISIIDNEIADISLELPENINEGDKVISGKAIVGISTQAGKDVSISLTSDSPLNIMVPKEIVIPKGKDKISFDFSVIDDNEFNDIRTVFITASVKAWNPVTRSLDIYDNEIRELELVVPAEASENDRIIQGNLSIPGTFESDLIVDLLSGNTGEIVVPLSITIPAGKMNVDFGIEIIDDPDIDGSQTTAITASAPGWTQAESSIEVLDNDPGEIQFSASQYTAWENSGNALITIIRKNSYNSKITIDYKTTESSDINRAVSHEDYIPVSGTLIFESGETQKSFSIPILQDNIIEGGEVINLILENPSYTLAEELKSSFTAELIITDKMIWEKQAGADFEPSYTENHIKSIWGSSNSDIYAAGWQSTILHFNGKTWENADLNTGRSLLLEGIWGNSGSDIFAVGSNGVILYFNGSGWKPMTSGTGNNLYCIWGISKSDIYAAGAGVILRYNGIIWQEMMSIDTEKMPDIRAIWGTSESDIFAAGCDGIILHYDGVTWQKMEADTNVHLYDIWGSSGSDVFAVGAFGIVTHYDGSTWKKMNTGIDNILFLEAVRGSSGSDVYAAGSGGTVLHYDGTVWMKMELDTDINFNDLWCRPLKAGSGLDLFAVGEAGTIYHYTPYYYTPGIIID